MVDFGFGSSSSGGRSPVTESLFAAPSQRQTSGKLSLQRKTAPAQDSYSIGRAGTNEQFPDAEALARLEANKTRADKVASAFSSMGIAVPDNIRALQQDGFQPEEPNFFESMIGSMAGTSVGKGVLGALNILGAPARTIQTGLKLISPERDDLIDQGFGTLGISDIPTILWGSPEKMEELTLRTGIDVTNGSQTLSMWGWDESDTALGKGTRFVGHAAMEIFTDPLSYITFGASGIGRKALGESADAAVRKVTREAIEGVTDTAAHRTVANRLRTMTDEMVEAAFDGDDAMLREIAGYVPGGEDFLYKDWKRRLGDFGEDVFEDGGLYDEIAEHAYSKVVGEAENMTSSLLQPGKLLSSVRDEVVGPVISRQFKDIPEEWVEHLPAYARGGMRLMSPLAFTQKSLSKGWQIPGTVGKGREIWQSTGQKVIDKIASSKFPFANSKTWNDVVGSIRKGLDINRTLIQGVKDGKIRGGEYMIIQDAMSHAVTQTQLEALVPRLLFEEENLNSLLEKEIKNGTALGKTFEEAGAIGSEALDVLHERNRRLNKGLYNFIVGEGDELRINDVVVDTTSEIYERAREFRDYARSVMTQYNDAIEIAIPDYASGIKNYLPVTMEPGARDFITQLAVKAPRIAEKLAMTGPEGGADYFIGQMLAAVSHGGVAEAAIGSNVHLGARTFNDSPVVSLADGTPTVMLRKDFADQFQGILENVKPGEINVSQINDMIEGRLKELAMEHNVPLPKGSNARPFDENPFNLINAYAHSMETTLRQRNAIEILREYGMTSSITPQMAVQRTIQEIRNRVGDEPFINQLKNLQDRLEEVRAKGVIPPSQWKDPEKRAKAAHWLRNTMNTYDPETGFATGRMYDHVSPVEKVERYFGGDEAVQVMFHRFVAGPEYAIDKQFDLPKFAEAAEQQLPPNMFRNARITPDGKWEIEVLSPVNVTPDQVEFQWIPISKTDRESLQFQIRSHIAAMDKYLTDHGQPERLAPWRRWERFDMPRAQHSGTEASAAQIARGKSNPLVQEVRLKGTARIAPEKLTDEQANLIQRVADKRLNAGEDFDLMEALTTEHLDNPKVLPAKGTDKGITVEDAYRIMTENDVIRYVNGGEDIASISYVVLNKDAVDSVIDVTDAPLGYFDPTTNLWHRDVPEDFGEVFDMQFDPESGYHIFNVKDTHDLAARAHLQREALRFGKARNAEKMMIKDVDTGRVMWKGLVQQSYQDVADDTVLAQGSLAMQRVMTGAASIEDDIIGQSDLVREIAKAFRRNANDAKTPGIGNFDPEDADMLGFFEEINLLGANEVKIVKYKDGTVRAIHAADEITDDMEAAVVWMNGSGKKANAKWRNAIEDSNPIEAFGKDWDKVHERLRWLSKNADNARLIRDVDASSTWLSMDIVVEELDNYLDWSKMSDFDVYHAAFGLINGMEAMDPNVRRRFLGWAHNTFPKGFVEQALKTPEEILKSEIKIGEFMDNLERLFSYGRAGTAVDAQTQFLTKGKTDGFERLLETAKNQAKALGFDPDTFEPVRVQLANQSYQFKHPVTGEIVERNLINPRAFGLGGPAIEGEVIAVELAEWFSQITENAASIYTPIGFATLAAHTRSATGWWKSMATVTKPTFHIRNAVGAAWNNQIIGVGAKDYALVRNGAVKIRNAMDKGATIEEAIAKLTPRQSKMFKAAFEEGMFGNSFSVAEIKAQRGEITTAARGALQKVNPLSQQGFGVQIGGNVMETLEDFMRMSAFAAWYDPDNPATAKVAREMALAVHFDYKNLTKFETRVKEFLPFFVWQRRNIPLQLQVLAERPGLMTRYAHLMSAAEANFGSNEGSGTDMPTSPYQSAFAADTGIVMNEGTEFWARVFLDPDIPVKDLFETFDSLNPLEVISNFGEGLNPIYTAAFDFQSQADFGDVNAPAPMNVVMAQLARAGIFDKSIDGDVQVPYWLRTLYNTTLPWANEYSAYAEAALVGAGASPGLVQNDPKALGDLGIATDEASNQGGQIQDALQILGMTLGRGVGVTPQTPRTAAGAAFAGSETLADETNAGFRNIPGFADAYEEQSG